MTLPTSTAKGGERMITVPSLIQIGYGERKGEAPRIRDIHDPVTTVVAGGIKVALVSAFLAQHNTGVVGRAAGQPLSTVTVTGSQQQIVAANLMHLKGTQRSARDLRDPLTTVCAGGTHASLVAAMMVKFYGTGTGQPLDEPLHTVTARDTFGLVTVQISGTTYVITDIGMRMLTPRELFRAQGFPDDYIIDRGADGKALSKTAQIRMCGNSVCPPLAEALVRANCEFLMKQREVA